MTSSSDTCYPCSTTRIKMRQPCRWGPPDSFEQKGDSPESVAKERRMNWLHWALLSALFAGLTAVLAKPGVKEIDSNLATAIRTAVILVFAWSIALATKSRPLGDVPARA